MDIAIERHVSPEELLRCFEGLAPELEVGIVADALALIDAPPFDISIVVQRVSQGLLFGQFGVEVNTRMRCGRDLEAWLCGLARELSRELASRTLYSGAPTTVDPLAPYCCVVWDGDTAYLGDDADLDPGDGSDGAVRVLHRLDLETVRFASRTELVEWVERNRP